MDVVLVGATTENPSFALNAALLSRCQVLVLNRLDDNALEKMISRAEAVTNINLNLDEDARRLIKAMADGDGRYLLNLVETVFAQEAEDNTIITSETLTSILSNALQISIVQVTNTIILCPLFISHCDHQMLMPHFIGWQECSMVEKIHDISCDAS